MFLDTYQAAILEEYSYAKQHIVKMPLFEPKFMYEEGDKFVYSFNAGKELGIPDSTPVIVYNAFKNILGEVLYINGDEIVLMLSEKIDIQARIEFSSSVHVLLLRLVERLKTIDYSSSLVKQLINGRDEIIEDSSIKKGQDIAIEFSCNNPISIIWGPPGTGKTYTLAEIAWRFYKQGKSVLVVSQSNIAVDNAMLAIKKKTTFCDEGKIFRAGYSKIKDIVSKSNKDDIFINVHQYIEKTEPELILEKDNLLKLKDKEKDPEKLKIINNRIRLIRQLIVSKEVDLISNAKILGTTISKATVDDRIYNRKFDVVLFDESSMAYIPQVLYACSLALSNFICIGDFRQLPPIVQCSEENILNKDIFHFLSIFDGYRFRNHKWLVMLYEQRRMAPKIADFVNENIYNDEIANHESVYENREDVIERAPIAGYTIGYFNTDNISANALSKMVGFTNSHFNIVSAFISVLLAIQAMEDGQKSVAILAPYKNQVNLIKNILKDVRIPTEDYEITCSTIHQYQGRESDVVVFDSVDGYPMKTLGKMLQNGDDTNRLINVAVTRARGKFIFIGSRHKTRNSGVFNRLYDYLFALGKEILLEDIPEMKQPRLLFTDSKKFLEEDIKRVNKKLCFLASSAVIDDLDLLKLIDNHVSNSNADFIAIDKNISQNDSNILLGRLSSSAEKKRVFKSFAYSLDSIICFDDKAIWVPIYSNSSKSIRYIGFHGKRATNIIKDFEVETIESEINMGLTPLKAIPKVGQNFVVCPQCGLNFMLEGQDCCSVCLNNKILARGDVFIDDKNKVSRFDILFLWSCFTGEKVKFFIKSIRAQSMIKILRTNPNIKHIYENNDYYFDKNDVFNEFFRLQPELKKYITKWGISSYDDLFSRRFWIRF